MGRFKRGTRIQSIYVKRTKGLSLGEAKSMVREAGFDVFKIDVKPNQYRFRQAPPSAFMKGTFRTVDIGKPGELYGVIGVPKLGKMRYF